MGDYFKFCDLLRKPELYCWVEKSVKIFDKMVTKRDFLKIIDLYQGGSSLQSCHIHIWRFFFSHRKWQFRIFALNLSGWHCRHLVDNLVNSKWTDKKSCLEFIHDKALSFTFLHTRIPCRILVNFWQFIIFHNSLF